MPEEHKRLQKMLEQLTPDHKDQGYFLFKINKSLAFFVAGVLFTMTMMWVLTVLFKS